MYLCGGPGRHAHDVAKLSDPEVTKSTKKSISQPKKVVVYLCGGSGRHVPYVANLFSPKVSKSTKKPVSQP